MDKSVFYDLFNEKLDEFFQDLVNTYPHVSEFRRFKSGLTVMKNLDPKSPENIFRTYFLYKYRDAVLSKDESFFLNDENYELYCYEGTKDYWLEFIHKLKQMWQGIDADNKEIVWKYFHVLIVLSEKCHEAA